MFRIFQAILWDHPYCPFLSHIVYTSFDSGILLWMRVSHLLNTLFFITIQQVMQERLRGRLELGPIIESVRKIVQDKGARDISFWNLFLELQRMEGPRTAITPQVMLETKRSIQNSIVSFS